MDDDLEQRIRERAYQIWEQEGRPEGRENGSWDRLVFLWDWRTTPPLGSRESDDRRPPARLEQPSPARADRADQGYREPGRVSRPLHRPGREVGRDPSAASAKQLTPRLRNPDCSHPRPASLPFRVREEHKAAVSVKSPSPVLRGKRNVEAEIAVWERPRIAAGRSRRRITGIGNTRGFGVSW